ncbi:MAG TPA: polysaccharide biosynthesis protein [Polyangia bacterium]|nr:polysaccharide biosynthesis protein [Polyangia bacterium]
MRWWLVKSAICLLAFWSALALTLAWTDTRSLHPFVLGSLFLGVQIATTGLLGSFHELWSHTSLEDLVALIAESTLSTLTLAVILLAAPSLAAPQIAFIDGGLALTFLCALRVAPRVWREVVRPRWAGRSREVLLVGRPELVDLELRRMKRQPAGKDRVAGLVLDGPPLDGARMHRLRVLGRPELERMMAAQRVHEVTVVPPTSPAFGSALQKLCNRHRVPFRPAASLLALSELLDHAEQLLDRVPSKDGDPLSRDAVAGKTVLVTGAGGSIGRELSLQLLACRPKKLILVNRGENTLFHAERLLASANDCECLVEGHVLDVRSEAAVQRLFARHRPQLVFHAAAHKHVPLMERHPAEAVLNNVGGARVVAQAAHGYGAEGFVFISTDKAVRPTSIMGATKRIGELYVRALAARSTTRLVSVRFGNVLGSNGSVLPIFIEQVQRGGPVTVTHQEMTRYFMSIPEACRLVLRASARGRGGELYVLEMGCPMRIVDLAARVIERAGLRPGEDVPITFSGARPGEKLAEELMTDRERASARVADGVWSVDIEELSLDRLGADLDELIELAETGDDVAVRARLAQLLPEFRGIETGREDVTPYSENSPALVAM